MKKITLHDDTDGNVIAGLRHTRELAAEVAKLGNADELARHIAATLADLEALAERCSVAAATLADARATYSAAVAAATDARRAHNEGVLDPAQALELRDTREITEQAERIRRREHDAAVVSASGALSAFEARRRRFTRPLEDAEHGTRGLVTFLVGGDEREYEHSEDSVHVELEAPVERVWWTLSEARALAAHPDDAPRLARAFAARGERVARMVVRERAKIEAQRADIERRATALR